MKIEDIKAYEIIKKKDVGDLNSKGYLLKHKKSGARIFILSNDDRNKVFYVAFRTPPMDSCGTPHILEHTVLCGSRKYKAKDPFIELAKGSLNTFLNAMTYPDKTVYPVASTNDKDFKNLSDVYMDAVLHPAIYENEKIFRQEGWHYELEDEDGELTYNGVVYNEMKGAFSAPDDVLDRFTYTSLYPDTAYALESGGDPGEIPDLTYERFIELHKKYYHPVNSYIYLYGDADMAERLEWLDKEYLSHYDKIEIDSELKMQKPFKKQAECEKSYSLSDGEDLKDNTYLSVNYVVADNLDPKLYIAFQILQYVLLDCPGAPLKQALLDAGIGKDVESTYENGIRQPYFSVIAKYANKEDKDRFLKVINDTLKKLIKEGFDKKTLLGGLNVLEFRYREADFGHYPKGLMYGLQSLDSWLFDENDPFMHIEQNATYGFLRKEIEGDTRYFEKLAEKYLLNNPHSSVVILVPEKGLTAKQEKKVAKKLDDYKASLSKAEIKKIIKETAELKKYQSEPSTQEQLETIPLLEIKDIEKKAQPFKNEITQKDGTKYIHHDIFTNGIAYIGLMFSMQSVPERLICHTALLRYLIGSVNTKNYSYQELNSEINLATGGISGEITSYVDVVSGTDFDEEFELRTRVKEENTGRAFELMEEMLFTSDFSDKKRIKEIVGMIKSRMQASLPAAGHLTASARALSYICENRWYAEKVNGLDFYEFIDGLERDFDSRFDSLKKGLKEALGILLHKDNFMFDMTGSKKAYKKAAILAGKVKERLNGAPSKPAGISFKLKAKNEGLRCASQVQYVAKAGSFADAGLKYRGELKVLKVIMGYDYLWNNVRVLGGAYGCMSMYSRAGNACMVSYRDPHLKETIDIFEKAADYIKNFSVSKRDMTKFIIGAISDEDTPLNPKAEGMRSLTAYMSGLEFEDVQRDRDEILSCTPQKVRELAPYLESAMKKDILCVVGSETKIDENKKLFKEVRNLL
ncbi:MAG: insulinase family protein [Lachnospiraceae bacterium]|nr:insulinase family protein [Lachnospiraceae bacterium]